VPDNCKFSSGEVAQVDGDDRLQAGAAGCTFEKGAVILLSYDSPEDGSASAPSTAELAPTKKEDTMPNPTPVQQAPAAAPEAAAAPAHTEAHPTGPAEVALPPVAEAPAELQAYTEVPAAPSADDLAKLAESAGGNPMLAIGLAALAVLGGGGAMWKHIQKKGEAKAELDQKRAEQEHELKLKELELKAQSSSGPDYSATQPPPCQAAAVKQEQSIASLGGQVSSLKGELEELRAKLAKVEKKSASFSADFDAEEMSERVEKLEKALKANKRGSKA
jgi:uncharacterized protein HemX